MKNVKRIFALILSAALVLMVSSPALASTVSTGGFTVNGTTLTGYSGSGGAVTIPNTVTAIDANVFKGKTNITSVTIPSSVTSIGGGAFEGCTGLTTVTVPGSVASLGTGVFSGCTSLSSVSLQASVSSIPDSTFYGCSSLNSIAISASITSIGANAFSGCNSLASMAIPEGITTVGSRAFANCNSLRAMSIPSTCTSFSIDAVTGSNSLESITVAVGNGTYTSDGGCVYNSPMTKLLLCPPGKYQLVVSSSCKVIGAGAVPEGAVLTSVDIPEGVTTIESGAFGSSSIKSVSIPETVASIGSMSSSFHPDVIYGYHGTAAQEYADDNGFIFYDLDGYEDDVDEEGTYADSGAWAGDVDADDLAESGETANVNVSSNVDATVRPSTTTPTKSTATGAYSGTTSNSHRQDSTPKTGDNDMLFVIAIVGLLLMATGFMFLSKRKEA